MKLKKLSIQNFLSISSIALDLDDRGLVLLKGINKDNDALNNNGSGKSSILEALVYALYARTIRGLKGDAVVHRIPGKNMKIFLDFEDDDGTQYRIARYRKHNVNKNKSFLYKNGKDITPKSEMDFNKAVADLLQADYLTFTSSLLYSGESFKFTSATDAEMKATFDTMLGLDIYQKCLEITKSRLKDLQAILDKNESRIEYLKQVIEKQDLRIADTKAGKDGYDTAYQDKANQLAERLQSLQDKLLTDRETLKDLNSTLSTFESNMNIANRKLNAISDKLEEIEKLKLQISEIKSDIKGLENSIAIAKRGIHRQEEEIDIHLNSINRYEAKIDNYQKAMKKLDKTIGTPCPTCGAPLTEKSIQAAKEEYQDQIDTANKIIRNEKRAVLDCVRETEKLETDIKEYNDAIKEHNSNLETLNDKLSKAENAISNRTQLQTDFDKAKEKYWNQKVENDRLDATIKATEELIKNAKKDIDDHIYDNPYVKILECQEKDKRYFNEEISQIKERIGDKLEEKEILKFWEKAYSNQGIKSLVLDDITPFLNRRVNKYLSKLTSGHIEVKFNTQTVLKSGEKREKFSLEISNQDGGVEYSANSGGEKRRIDLAVNLALQDLVASRSNKKINIAIFDEVFDTLDERGIENVIQLLQELQEEKSTIFVVSHNEHLQSYFTNHITVKKENGMSTIIP